VKHPVITLATLACLGATAPALHAVSIKDDALSLGFGIRMQTRAQANDANGTTGGDYRVNGGTAGAVDDPVDFYIRRARLYLNIKYGSDWKGQLAFNADNVDRAGTNDNRAAQLRYAWMERGFDLGDGMSHAIHFGLDKPYNNPSDSAMSASRELMPNSNAAAGYLAPRGVGVGYRFFHPVFLVAADLQNNTNGAKDNTGANAQEEDGFFYGVRAEFSFSPDWFIKKRAESYLGKEGHGLNLGLSYGTNQDAVVADADAVTAATQPGQTSLTSYSVDAMLWWNNISAYAEYRAGTGEATRNDGVAVADVDAEFIVLQVGYAIPLGEGVVEPAVRYQIIDANTDADEVSVYGNNTESGGSGTQLDLGVNYYLSGHDHKFHLAVSLWEAEEGEADATIVRLQHQINF
jgi:hypothetical protein